MGGAATGVTDASGGHRSRGVSETMATEHRYWVHSKHYYPNTLIRCVRFPFGYLEQVVDSSGFVLAPALPTRCGNICTTHKEGSVREGWLVCNDHWVWRFHRDNSPGSGTPRSS